MDEMRYFRGLQIYFAIFGYNFSLTKNEMIKTILQLILCFFLSVHVITVGFGLAKSADNFFNDSDDVSRVQSVIDAVQWISMITFFISIKFKLDKIMVLVNALGFHFNERDSKFLFKISFLIFIPLTTFVIRNLTEMMLDAEFDRFEFYVHRLGLKKGSLSITIIRTHSFYLVICYFNLIITISCLYSFLSLMMYVAKRNILLSMIESTGTFSALYIGFTIKKCNHLIRLHAEFESIMSIYPFLIFSNLFLDFNSKIDYARLVSESGTRLFSLYFDLVIKTIISFSNLALIIICNQRLESMVTRLRLKIIDKIYIDNGTKIAILSCIGDAISRPNTALGVFRLDPPLFLNFFSGLITFTILFLNLP